MGRHPDLLQLGDNAGVRGKLAAERTGSEVRLLHLRQLQGCLPLQPRLGLTVSCACNSVVPCLLLP